MQKDIFFFSNFCQFSKNVIGIITKHNIRELFLFVSLDEKKYNIPQFVDRVPCILKQSGEVFMDDELIKYLELVVHKRNSQNNDKEISPMLSVYGKNTTYSTNFSPLEGENEDDNPNFLFLGRDQRMINVQDDNKASSTTSKKSDECSIAYEKLMDSRQRDDNRIKQTINNNNLANR